MARLRKFAAYRRLDRPYTRTSKYKKKSYVKALPRHIIVRFVMGNLKKNFKYTFELKSKDDLNIRHNSIESARQSSNRLLEKELGKEYRLQIVIFPHHILRENPVAAGAGADRFSTGMSHNFGKPHTVAARVKKGQTMFKLSVDKGKIVIAREALKRIQHKLPCSCLVEMTENKKA
jgi:large subunit ribosomal protein L10e|tara:strand:- start:113 stop:640 length:528 start_codon:yes stop_codon:yes gene_type:complete